MSKRRERMSAIIRKELAKIISREMEFGGALVTVVALTLSEKMGSVTVEVSVFPPEKAERAVYVLNKSSGYLKHLLNKRLDFGRVPTLSFRLSKGVENMERVEELLEEIGVEDLEDDEAPDEEE